MGKNEYEKYKHPGIVDFAALGEIVYYPIFQSGMEAISVCVSMTSNKRFVYGYDIFFKDGRQVIRRPGELDGWFDSCDNAVLHAIAHMLSNREFFTIDAVGAMKDKVKSIIQKSLFA